MKRAIRSCRNERVFCAFAIAAILSATSASAQPAIAPTVRSHFSATPVPFEQARLALENPKKTVAFASSDLTAGTTPPEIVELARALKNDPDLIYQYVHDNIEFSPLFGLLKGPVGTLLDGRGNSFDQAALMVALLNQASLANPSISNVLFEFGQLNLTSAQLQGWLGVDNNPDSVGGVLASGGIPASLFVNGDGTLAFANVGHLWVKVSINGTPFVFDPAFKSHSFKTGIVSSLPAITGYSQAQFVSDAGATVTATSIQNVNRTNLRNDLTTYAGKLATYIRANLPTAGITDVVGGGTILPVSLVNGQTVRQATNPNQTGSPTDWASIPSQYFATLSVTLPGAATQIYNSADIYGHRLSIFFNASFVPTLYLDGSAVVSGSQSSKGAQVGIGLSVNIPWATFANQSLTQFVGAQTNLNGGTGGYVVQTGWDQVGRGMIEKHRKLLHQAINSGAAATSELALGESLVVLGYTWLAECAAQQRLSDQLLGTASQYFYGGGIVGMASGTTISSPYVDLPLNFINSPARVNGSGAQTPNSIAAFLDGSGTSSSFESTSLEQTQASVPGFVAASTVKLLDIATQNGDTIFDISSPQVYNTIRPQLVPNYAAGNLATIDNYVAQGFRVIAPLHGRIPIGSWTGVGFKTMLQSGNAFSYGEIISGGLSGGFGGVNDPPVFFIVNADGSMTPVSGAPGANGPGGNGNVGDPIDRRKGSYQYTHTDLAVGAKGFPYGLSFERSYDSGAQGIPGPLGAGWTHNFAITAAVGSDGFTGMGEGSPLNAVSSIVALYVSSDLVRGQALQGQSNLQNFVLETVVNRWFTDQLTQNVVNVSRGWNSEQFTKMADGSYSPPVGSASIVDASGGTFRYRTKAGVTMSFNASGQISSWTNAAGASVSFTYAGGLLSTVRNSATARQLSLAYGGSQLSSVSDGTRSASYGYSNGNLTSFVDALGQGTTFAYDTSGSQDTAGHLTQVFYPSNPSNAFVTNFYDSLGRVRQQKDANGNLTQAFFAGARTEIDDPVGNRHVWYNDPRGNVTNEVQDYGPSSHLNVTTLYSYDGQSNLVSAIMPEGNSVNYSYDALFNSLTITRTPKLGSPLQPLVQRFSYVAPVASLPNFEEVQTSTDPKGNVTTYSYNSGTGTLAEIDRPAVAKPGAGVSIPKQVFTYTAIGLVQTSQDAEGRVTRYDYDATFADQIAKVTSDSGRLNLMTQFSYDGYGDVSSVTDANGKTTTSTFDKLRRVTEVDGAIAGVVTKYTYYPDGPMKTMARQVTSGNFETKQYAYTLSDKIKTVTDPLGNTVTNTYDADDRKQTVTSQVSATQNRQRTFSYDALSRLSQISDTTAGGPGTPLETNGFTPNSNRQNFTDANNHTTTYLYDGFDRLSQTTYPGGGTERYQYDANGRVLQKTVRSGQTIGYAYDPLNRISTKTPAGESAGQVIYGYDLTGRLLQASDASGPNPYTIAYDTAGRAVSFTDQQGRNTQVQYDGVGNRTRLQWPANTNGSNPYFVTYSFDALNRMTEIDANGLPSTPLAKYQWDSVSRLTLITYGDGTSDSYSQYDADDKLQALTENFTDGSSATFTYGWQKNRQRQSTTVDNSAFQYDPAVGATNYGPTDVDNGYTTVDGASLTYDGSHNLTYDGFNAFTYDVENRLIQAQNAVSGTSQYLYDPLGQRKQKQVGTVITQFVLVDNDEIADYSGAGVGTPIQLTVRGHGGLPVAAITPSNGTVAYYHHDALGSTVAVTQAGTSGPLEIYTYGEFGVPGAGNWATYRFAGYRYDAETGLYYLRARYYSPQLGRFLQPDPIGYSGGRNLYAYVNNNPLNSRDPRGTCDSAQGCGFFGSILNFVENHPFISAGIAVAAVAAVILAPELLLAGEALEEGGTVWEAITATQELYEGTVIPRSFTLATEGADVWVAPNATEHLAEYALGNLGRGVGVDLVNIGTQAQLTSLQAAVEAATANGVTYGTMLTEGGWELIFSPARAAGQLPALIHALYLF